MDMPGLLKPILRRAPISVLPTLVLLALTHLSETLEISFLNIRVLAGIGDASMEDQKRVVNYRCGNGPTLDVACIKDNYLV